MTLQELKFNGSNGHSRILIMPSREEIGFSLVSVAPPTLLDISRFKNKRLEEKEASQRREIEYHSIPFNAAYFARSEEHEGLYVGVQYYRAATAADTLEERIPVGSPYILKLPQLKRGNYDAETFLHDCMPKGARSYEEVRDIFGKVAAVQFWK